MVEPLFCSMRLRWRAALHVSSSLSPAPTITSSGSKSFSWYVNSETDKWTLWLPTMPPTSEAAKCTMRAHQLLQENNDIRDCGPHTFALLNFEANIIACKCTVSKDIVMFSPISETDDTLLAVTIPDSRNCHGCHNFERSWYLLLLPHMLSTAKFASKVEAAPALNAFMSVPALIMHSSIADNEISGLHTTCFRHAFNDIKRAAAERLLNIEASYKRLPIILLASISPIPSHKSNEAS